MELGGIPLDQYAGYIEEESDLEYSGCSEGESSGDEQGFTQCSKRDDSPDPSEDEFEREMESEVMGALELMASATAIHAATRNAKHMTSLPSTSHTAVQATDHDTGRSGGVSVGKASMEGRLSGDSGVAGHEGGPSTLSTGVAGHHASEGGPSTLSEKREGGVESEYYDDVYFDSSSGSDEGGAERGGKKKRERKKGKVRKLTNDELFYDPHMDEEDEKWVARQRMAYHNVKESQQLEQKRKQREVLEAGGDGGTKDISTENKAPQSDAILNCPACLTTLCLDCQRHDTYVNQYRAMFVLNCQIVRDEVLKYAPKLDKKSRKRRRKEDAEMAPVQEDFHPVRCSECNTEVAVYDKEEVFHFFNVLASAP